MLFPALNDTFIIESPSRPVAEMKTFESPSFDRSRDPINERVSLKKKILKIRIKPKVWSISGLIYSRD